MTKKEIVDAVMELVQDSSAAMRGNLGRWVNFVLDDIASRGLLRSLQREEIAPLIPGNGVSDQVGRNYDLADDTDKVSQVFVPAWGKEGIFTKVSDKKFLEKMLCDGPALTGQPRYYMVFGLKTLRVHPIPSTYYAPATPTDLQKLHVWKYKDIAHLTENQDVTEIKMKHVPLLVGGAYAYGARFDDFTDLGLTMQQYEAGIRRLFFDQVNEIDRPVQTAYNDT